MTFDLDPATSDLTLFGRGGVNQSHDELGRFFTPDALALQICEQLRDHLSLTDPKLILEPSVGGGAFARAVRKVWPRAFLYGVDLDPNAEGLVDCDDAYRGDFLQMAHHDFDGDFDLVIGNPPFTGPTAIKHVETALRVSGDLVCFILPWAPLGGVQAWGAYMSGPDAPECAWPIVPRPWPKNVRETAAFVWDVNERKDTGTMVRWLPRWKV